VGSGLPRTYAAAEQGQSVGLRGVTTDISERKLWLSLNMRVVRDETGAAICREGTIEDITEPGHGTTFKVYLPQLLTVVKKTVTVVEAATPRGMETILLVEDEDVVRGLARKILEQAGYNVIEAMLGKEAVRLCIEEAPKIDMLLTDVVMPETSGKEVADRLTELLPGLKVLFMSGYTDEAIVHHGVLDSNIEFIQKPFTPSAVSKKAREVLDSELVVT